MDRRTAIRNLALVMSSAAVLPYCTTHTPAVHYKHFDIDAGQEGMISEISETIIPKTGTPGSKDLRLHLFVLKMVDDCSKKTDQQLFLKGMADFAALAKSKYGRPFTECSRQQRESLLNSLEIKGNSHPKEIQGFYQMVKGLTAYGYTTSQYFMTKLVKYEQIPGRYNAFYPVNKLKQA
jgi:hypothetical protein